MRKTLNSVFLCVLFVSIVNAQIKNVTKYGVTPNDNVDDTDSIQNIFDHLNVGEKVFFPSGTYNIKLEEYLKIESKKNIEIFGEEGTEFIKIGFNPTIVQEKYPQSLFVIKTCKNITVRNIDAEIDKPVSINGEVIAMGTDHTGWYYVLKLAEEFREYNDVLDSILFLQELSYDKDGTPNYHFAAGKHNLKNPIKIVKTDDLTLKVYSRAKSNKGLLVGDLMNIRVGNNGAPLYQILSSEQINIEDHNLWNWYGNAVYVGNLANDVVNFSRDITVNRFKVDRRPNSTRLMINGRDGIHVVGGKGTVKILNSTFRRMGDDGVNVHSRLGKIKKINHNTITAVNGWSHKRLDRSWAIVQDTLVFVDPNSGLSKGTSIITSIEDNGKFELQDASLGLNKNDIVYNKSNIPKVIVDHCEVSYCRARGVVLQTEDIVVENSKFNAISGAAIMLTIGLDYWYEGALIEKALIEKNKINNCGNYLNGYGSIMVVSNHDNFKGVNRAAGVMKNITITNNAIENTKASAIFVSSTDSFKITSNTIKNTNNKPKLSNAGTITIKNSNNGFIKGNTIENSYKKYFIETSNSIKINRD